MHFNNPTRWKIDEFVCWLCAILEAVFCDRVTNTNTILEAVFCDRGLDGIGWKGGIPVCFGL